ncbi:MAG: glycoside hydrolase family 88 protein [Lachnospiraceae bacterium]|nr:glycoside hydrolase family 88 protein [Lachnospiraceae bacterium]
MFEKKAEISNNEAKIALETSVKVLKNTLRKNFGEYLNHSSVNGIYPVCKNDQWTNGFYVGELWLAYEFTGDEEFKRGAEALIPGFIERIKKKIAVDHHDMGFLYSPSCIAAHKLTGNEEAKEAAILAADMLISRFQEKGEFLQAWGAMGEEGNYRYIIDCLLNLPLLYRASEMTGDDKYRNIALKHITTCLKYSIRPDGSTYHTFFMDKNTGGPLRGETCQGYSNESFWARGQAWGVYGTALSYRYTHKEEYKDAFKKTLDFYLSKLPEDMVPYWDMIFTEGEEPRDSSSASIVACGLLEMANLVGEEEAAYCRSLAAKMLKSLADNYAVKPENGSNGLVLHGTYSKKSPYNTCSEAGVDECVSWGDYFYMEALTRFTKDWDTYW